RRALPAHRGPLHRLPPGIEVLRAAHPLHERHPAVVRDGALRSRSPDAARPRGQRALGPGRIAPPLSPVHDGGLARAARGVAVAALTAIGLALVQSVTALALAPALIGLIRWIKARLQNRRGAVPWQPYFEIQKLFAKEVVLSPNASWLFRAAPFVVFASTLVVTTIVPVLAMPIPLDSVGDLLVVVYLLLLGTFALALA